MNGFICLTAAIMFMSSCIRFRSFFNIIFYLIRIKLHLFRILLLLTLLMLAFWLGFRHFYLLLEHQLPLSFTHMSILHFYHQKKLHFWHGHQHPSLVVLHYLFSQIWFVCKTISCLESTKTNYYISILIWAISITVSKLDGWYFAF